MTSKLPYNYQNCPKVSDSILQHLNAINLCYMECSKVCKNRIQKSHFIQELLKNVILIDLFYLLYAAKVKFIKSYIKRSKSDCIF